MNEKLLMKLLSLATEDIKVDENDTPFKIGKCYAVRTFTYHSVGRLKEIKGGFLVLEDGSWIPDWGRFSTAINSGEINEVEKVESLIFIPLNSIADAFEWKHDLPKVTK